MNYENILKYGVKGMKRGVRKPATPSTPAATIADAPNPDAPKTGVTGKTVLQSKDLNKLARMTDNNDHSGAIVHGTKMLGRDDLHDRAKAVQAQHNKDGHLTGENSAKRQAIYTEMMDHAKENLHPSDHAKFNGSF